MTGEYVVADDDIQTEGKAPKKNYKRHSIVEITTMGTKLAKEDDIIVKGRIKDDDDVERWILMQKAQKDKILPTMLGPLGIVTQS